jgi:hypothetical protein
MTSRLPLLTIIGVLAAMLIATIHAFAECQLARVPRTACLFPSEWFA